MTRLLTITPLPYYSDPGTYFYRLRQRPDAILLDSGQPQSPSGRYDIISSDPLATLTIDQTGQIHCPAISSLSNDPLKAQQELLTYLDIEAPAT